VDEDRVYATGLSMGGYGTWSMAISFPKRFAAIAPVCGGGDPTKITEAHSNIAVWIFHGDKDFVVTSKEAVAMKVAMESVGAIVKMTLQPGLDHCSIIPFAYDNPEMYNWLLMHKRKC